MGLKSLLTIAVFLLAPLTAKARLTHVGRDFVNQTAGFAATPVMTAPTANGSYLMSMLINQPAGSAGDFFATLRWTDEHGARSRSLSLFNNHLPQGSVFPIRVLAGTPVTVETGGTAGTSYDLFVHGVGFWALGGATTSLSDYRKNLLLWSNATYPNRQSVFTAPSSDRSYLVRVNINEPANSSSDLMCVDILSTDEYSRDQKQTGCASPNGSPTMMVFPLRVKGGTAVQLVTYHLLPPKWGGSPTYNVTVDVIGF
jgi:hypothetical protein